MGYDSDFIEDLREDIMNLMEDIAELESKNRLLEWENENLRERIVSEEMLKAKEE